MKEMNQRKVLGISIKAFAILMLVVCFVYEITTPSARFSNMWFSYLAGVILYAIGFLMAFRQ
jgi:ABC-type nickel/cobalt efflux system permease component RcnA